jgi:hypothetical protein
VKGEILMEHEIINTDSKNAKSTLAAIVKFNAASCVILAALWALAALLHLQANPVTGLVGIGLLLGLLVTISALNARLRIQFEERDSE